MTTVTPLRCGLVGTGYWARITHAPALASTPGIEFAAVWGRDPQAARTLAAAHGATAHADLDELLASVDAVVFSVPPGRAEPDRAAGRPAGPPPAAREAHRADRRGRRRAGGGGRRGRGGVGGVLHLPVPGRRAGLAGRGHRGQRLAGRPGPLARHRA